MSARSLSSSKKSSGKRIDSSSTTKKGKKNVPQEDVIDHRQEQIDGLIREREEIRLKLNSICSKIIENVNTDDYKSEIDLTKQQPSDISLDKLLPMIDDICYYRTAFLNLFQEIDDKEKVSVQKRITQLSIDEPNLFRKRLTSDQRLTFVARERDLWKENAQLLQIMYATIVDQLEMNTFTKLNSKTTDILHSHRLNLEDVCLIFSSPNIRSINDAQKLRSQQTLSKELIEINDQQNSSDLEQRDNNSYTSSSIILSNLNEDKEHHNSNGSSNIKRTVLFANAVNIINDDEEIDHQQIKNDDQLKQKLFSQKSHLPLASNTLVDNMDSNLRMLIIKELSKDNYIQRPPSRRSSHYSTNINDLNSGQHQNRSRDSSSEWVELARLIGIDESEIDHWLSQSLQYPAGRVISTWCNSTSPSPTVAQLHSFLSTQKLNRLDLAHQIETMYNI
ncbi:unnamed protein product [Rotaria sp. Silwood2]|nr:unnamed protein product [Rotaria sp. Silwood2]CAF2696924.1 unnamed protein product [Rotaria sp. Silwood2]CAF4185867.1 unnamed protein product [Rotaria sp. Silwood2]CAF4310121.1 unnamed protein product [Rotaria sp. Silwood2]